MTHIYKWLLLIACFGVRALASAEPIFHEKHYPTNSTGPVPAVIALHSSGGYATITRKVDAFTAAGYAVYTPDFFKKHGITTSTRFDTWTVYRKDIEQELTEIVQLMKNDPRIDPHNIFAVGYSNGGYWTAYLSAQGIVNAGVSHYGVWDFPGNTDGYPAHYFSPTSHPLLTLIGLTDGTQKYERVAPQVEIAKQRSPAMQVQTYDAGHGWDCAPCKGEYVRNDAVTADALAKTLAFFKANTKQ